MEELHDFIESMGLLMERMGAARTFGRIFGLLLVAQKALSLDEMAELLQVSKPSISTNIRMIETAALAERVSVPGDRRHYYRIRPGSLEHSVAARLPLMAQMKGVVEKGIEAVEPDNEVVRKRLEDTRDFYEFIMHETEAALTRWRQRNASPLPHNDREP
jgi:DNA-binding transcriptional regulator GbsR (MarR family)